MADYNNADPMKKASSSSGSGNSDHHNVATASQSQQPSHDMDMLYDPVMTTLPRVLLMGPRRGGKTSIQRVVFQKMSPHETLFRLEATQVMERSVVDHTSLCTFTIWDFPGDDYSGQVFNTNNNHSSSNHHTNNRNNHLNQQLQQQQQTNYNYHPPSRGGEGTDTGADTDADNSVFTHCTSLIFVVDAQDEPYDHALQCFTSTVTRAVSINPNIAIEVFINKVDGELFLSDESKYDCRRDVMTQVSDELTDAGVSPDAIQIRYHLTSIYDHSIYEALSRVVQRLIPQLPTLENLLNVLVSTCNMEKAYLFDVVSKLYISTDSGPVDGQNIELCSDMLDVVLDVSGIYGLGPSHAVHQATSSSLSSSNDIVASQPARSNSNSHLSSTSPEPPPLQQQQHDNDEIEDNHNAMAIVNDATADTAYDSESASVIRLSNGMVLYLKEVDTMLALVCITRAENFRKKSLINYNIGCLRSALSALVVQPPVDNH